MLQKKNLFYVKFHYKKARNYKLRNECVSFVVHRCMNAVRQCTVSKIRRNNHKRRFGPKRGISKSLGHQSINTTKRICVIVGTAVEG